MGFPSLKSRDGRTDHKLHGRNLRKSPLGRSLLGFLNLHLHGPPQIKEKKGKKSVKPINHRVIKRNPDGMSQQLQSHQITTLKLPLESQSLHLLSKLKCPKYQRRKKKLTKSWVEIRRNLPIYLANGKYTNCPINWKRLRVHNHKQLAW
jgi:hypothetical protein